MLISVLTGYHSSNFRYIWRFLVGVSCVLRLFTVAIFSQNLKRSNRKGAIVQILTSMRVAELMGNVK